MATKFVDYQKVRGVNALVGASVQGSGNEIEIDIPGKSFVDVRAGVKEAFNGTSPTITVSGGGKTFISGSSLGSTGLISGGSEFFANDTTIIVAVGGSNATAGEAYVEVVYTNAEISDGSYTHEG